MVLIIGVLILLGITANNNTPPEILPGDGFNKSSVQFDVEAKSELWQSPGISLRSDMKEINFTVSGDIFLCGDDKKNFEQRELDVSASNPNFIDTNMKIGSGDLVKFELVPVRKQIANCGSVSGSRDFAFDEDGTFKNKDKKDLDAVALCRGGDIYEGSKFSFQKESSQGVEYLKVVDNADSWSVAGNKWLRADSTGVTPTGRQWYDGSFIDLRLSDEKNKNKIDGLDCTDATFAANKFFKKIESPEINSKCKKYARDGTTGFVFSYFEAKNADGRMIYVAEGLSAKIKDKNGISFACFDGNGKINACGTTNYSNPSSITTNSVKLKETYFAENISIPGKLFVGIADEPMRYSGNKGGYKVNVTHSCVKSDGDNLYLYVGDNIPTGLKPGDSGTVEVKTTDGKYKLTNTNVSGKLWFAIKDNMDGVDGVADYGNNKGSYKVNFAVSKSPTWISEAIHFMVGPLKDVIYKSTTSKSSTGLTTVDSGASFDFYYNLINGGIKNIVRSLLTLYIVVISMGFLLGTLQMKTDQIFMILFKIGAVLILLTDNSWYFLNKYLFNIFWYGVDDLIAIFVKFYNEGTGYQYKYDSSFKFLDSTLGSVLSWENITKFISLFFLGFSNPLAWALFMALAYAFFDMIMACFKGILLYCVAIIINGFLIGLAPIFMCFILFKVTFRFFDSWIKQLIGNMMSVVFYFISMGMMNEILYNVLYKIFNFGVYKDCMMEIRIGGLDMCLIQFPMPFAATILVSATAGGGQTAENMANILPINIPVVIIFIIITKCFHIIIDVVKTLPISIFGASMMYSPMDVADSAVEGAKYGIGMDRESIRRRQKAVGGANNTKTPNPRGEPTKNSKVSASQRGNPGDNDGRPNVSVGQKNDDGTPPDTSTTTKE